MKTAFVAPLFAALLIASPAMAAEGAKEGGKIVVEGTRVVELADGGSITLDKDGKSVRMKDGVVMTGKDGAKYMHKNDAVWKQITEKGTLAPNR
jgi:hypothetical protein